MRQIRIIVISLGIALVLTQYQNCAGANTSSTSGTSTVRLIDDVSNAGIQFPQPTLQLYEDATTVNIGGVCNDAYDGQSWAWSIAAGGSPLATGQGTCGHGQFMFEVAAIQNWVCGVNYDAEVSAEWGESTQMEVVKRCPPLAAQPLPSSNLGQPQTCQLEYRLSGDEANQGLCQATCFSMGILTSSEDQPIENCEGLIASLSGH